MTTSAHGKRTCPYVGLLPFSKEDAEYFFGRENESETLRLNLMASQSTLLYGASGVGKSSVINAGLIPALDRQDDVIVASFSEWTEDPTPGIKASIETAAKERLRHFEPRADASLAETLEHVADALADDIDDPDELIQRPGRVVVILDQVDEFIINYTLTAETERSLSKAFRRPHPSVAVMVSIREDWLARLDRFLGIFPTLLDNIIRLQPLSVEGAEAAITGPVARYAENYPDSGPDSVEGDLTRALVEQVRRSDAAAVTADSLALLSPRHVEARIDTALLQIVLTRLWKVEMQEGSRSLRLATLKKLGDASRILDEHLASVFDRFSAEQQDQAVEMFDRLVTPSETKIAQSAEDLAAYLNSDTGQLALILDTLAAPDARVLRAFAPRDRPESRRYELYHDLLARPIRGWLVGRRVEAQVDEYLSKRRSAEAEADRRIINRLASVGPASAGQLAPETGLPIDTIIEAASSLVQVGIVRTVGTDDPKYVFQPASGYRDELFRAPYAELLPTAASRKPTWVLAIGAFLVGSVTLALGIFHPLQIGGEGVLGELADATVMLTAGALFGSFSFALWNWQRDVFKGLASKEHRKVLPLRVIGGAAMAVFAFAILFFGIAYLSGNGEWLRGSGTLWVTGFCAIAGAFYASEEFIGSLQSSRRRPVTTEERDDEQEPTPEND